MVDPGAFLIDYYLVNYLPQKAFGLSIDPQLAELLSAEVEKCGQDDASPRSHLRDSILQLQKAASQPILDQLTRGDLSTVDN